MEKELKKVAELWAEEILHGQWDNGEPTQSFLGNALRALSTKPTHEQIGKFKTVLIEQCKKSFAPGEVINLGVDYHPDSELEIACKESGISIQLLPVKSNVYAGEGWVKYKFGYGTPLEEIKVN